MEQIIATTKEQGQRLLDSGVDVNTADMSYQSIGLTATPYHLLDDRYKKHPDTFPAWSASAMMRMLPSSIKINGEEHDLQLSRTDNGIWYVHYFSIYGIVVLKSNDNKNLIDVLVSAVEQLASDGFIKQLNGNQK